MLKVFIAPEFYFRSMYGGYTDMKYFDGEGAGRDPNSIVGGLANAVQDERWKNWLFVFGTSVVVAGPFILPETNNPKLSRKIAVLNTALVQKGNYLTRTNGLRRPLPWSRSIRAARTLEITRCQVQERQFGASPRGADQLCVGCEHA